MGGTRATRTTVLPRQQDTEHVCYVCYVSLATIVAGAEKRAHRIPPALQDEKLLQAVVWYGFENKNASTESLSNAIWYLILKETHSFGEESN